MNLTADSNKIEKNPYQMIIINYFPTSVQRLYKIETTGDWLNYNDQSFKVKQGDTIYAKGIDQYGNETRIIPSHTVNVAINVDAFDKNDITFDTSGWANNYIIEIKYMTINSTMQGRNIRVLCSRGSIYGYGYAININFLREDKSLISKVSRTGSINSVYTIPTTTEWISLS